jgi:hypothetical protein
VPEPLRITLDGIEYRVLDTVFRNGKHRAWDPPATWATARVFRPREGWRRLYHFASGEDRTAIDEATLRRQLASAEYFRHDLPRPRQWSIDPRMGGAMRWDTEGDGEDGDPR